MNYIVPEPPLDPPEDKIFGYCAHCGGEIYEGEDIYIIDSEAVHEDCLLDYVRENIAVRKEAYAYAKADC